MKSRAAAAIALGELGEKRAIPELKACLGTQIWDLKYAALMALEKLREVRVMKSLRQTKIGWFELK